MVLTILIDYHQASRLFLTRAPDLSSQCSDHWTVTSYQAWLSLTRSPPKEKRRSRLQPGNHQPPQSCTNILVSCHSSWAQGEGLDLGRGWICNSPFTLWYYSPHDIECVFVSRLCFSSLHFLFISWYWIGIYFHITFFFLWHRVRMRP